MKREKLLGRLRINIMLNFPFGDGVTSPKGRHGHAEIGKYPFPENALNFMITEIKKKCNKLR